MNDVQFRVMELVDEIDEICKQNNLKYVLAGKTAYRAKHFGEFQQGEYLFQIHMCYSDIMKLKKIVESQYSQTRIIESFSNNCDLYRMIFRYVDKTSTLIDVKRGIYYANPGIEVAIYVAREKKLTEKEYGCERYLLYLNNAGNTIDQAYLESVAKINRIKKLIGGKLTKKLFHRTTLEREAGMQWGLKLHQKYGKEYVAKYVESAWEKEETNRESEKYWYMRMNGVWVELPGDMFTNVDYVEFEGKQYPVAMNEDKYMRAILGAKWEKKARTKPPLLNEARCIYDVDIPYADFLAMIEGEGNTLKQSMENLRDYTQWKKAVYDPSEKRVKKTFRRIRCSVRQIDIYVKFRSKRKQMKEAYEKKDYKKLAALMKEYLSTTDDFMNDKIGFYINEEYFDYAKAVWEDQGKDDYAEKVYKYVPEMYRQENCEEYLKRRGLFLED